MCEETSSQTSPDNSAIHPKTNPTVNADAVIDCADDSETDEADFFATKNSVNADQSTETSLGKKDSNADGQSNSDEANSTVKSTDLKISDVRNDIQSAGKISEFHINFEEVMKEGEPPANNHETGRLYRNCFISVAMMIFSAALLFGMRGEAIYWISGNSDARIISIENKKDPDTLNSHVGQLVQMEGKPAGTAARFKKRFQMKELVVLKGTPVVLERRATNGVDSQKNDSKRPPDMAPVKVQGRLIRDDELADAYDVAFKAFLTRREIVPLDGHFYVLIQDERPRTGLQTPTLIFALFSLFLLNLRQLVKIVIKH